MTQKPQSIQRTQNVRLWQSGVTVCDPRSTETTRIEELGYIYIVLKELGKMLWNKLVT